MFGGILASIVLLAVTFGMLKFKTEEFDKSMMFGAIGCIMLLWVIPWGIMVIIPIAIILSIASPASREEWSKYKNRRIAMSIVLILLLNLFAFYPVSEPEGAEQWGNPIATENPHAAAWPASEQYTWVFVEPLDPTNFEIVQSLAIRTPHQPNPFQQAESSIWVSSLLGLQESRMRQAIDLVDERVPIRVDSDAFQLDQKGDAQSHLFRPTSGNVELNVWVYDVLSTSSTDPDGTKVGEVVVVGQSNWGGTVELVVIVRPWFHDGLSTDPYAESYVNAWLDA